MTADGVQLAPESGIGAGKESNMNRTVKILAAATFLPLLAACVSNETPRVSPNLEPSSCKFHEQYVCDVKSASRTRDGTDRTEFCRCERIDRIR